MTIPLCNKAPAGWWCSRPPGHDGPCAARRSAKVEHLASPGPDYWDWRCLKCGEPVDEHLSLPGLILAKLLNLLGKDKL